MHGDLVEVKLDVRRCSREPSSTVLGKHLLFPSSDAVYSKLLACEEEEEEEEERGEEVITDNIYACS